MNLAASKAVEMIGSVEWEYVFPIEDIKIRIEEQSKMLVGKNNKSKSLKDELDFLKHGGVSVNGQRRNRTIISINEKNVLDKETLID